MSHFTNPRTNAQPTSEPVPEKMDPGLCRPGPPSHSRWLRQQHSRLTQHTAAVVDRRTAPIDAASCCDLRREVILVLIDRSHRNSRRAVLPIPAPDQARRRHRPVSTPRVGAKAGRTFGAVAVLALTAACAGSATPATQPSRASLRRRIRGTEYTGQSGLRGPREDQRRPLSCARGTDRRRPDHVRYAISASGFAPMLFVYDGKRLLVHDPEEYRPWQLYDAPEEHPDQFASVSNAFSTPGSVEFAKNCRSAKVVGHQKILGRPATGYRCAGDHDSDGSECFDCLVARPNHWRPAQGRPDARNAV